MTNFAITGASGLIGSKLKSRLEQKGDKCNLEIDLRKGSNVLNINDYGHNFKTQPIDIFYHLGAFCKINECIENPKLSHKNNTNGIYEVLEFCRQNKIPKIIYTSSSRVLSPEENPYTASKKYAENMLEAYRQCYGIEYIIVRPSTVYGEIHDLTQRLITNWIIQALKGEPLIIYGDKNKTLDFTHVDDFVDGIELLVDNWDKTKNKAYDICGDDCRKLVDVYDEIIKQTGSKSPLVFRDAEVAQPQNIKISIEKIKEYGYSPKIKIEEGIKRLISFYQNEGKKWIE